MLVLTRKLQERIHIGDQITVTIVRIQGDRIRLGIEAPKNVRVMRGEVSARDAQASVELASPPEHADIGEAESVAEAGSLSSVQPEGQAAAPLAARRSRTVLVDLVPVVTHAV
jgi:carbon storage regulator CsrA